MSFKNLEKRQKELKNKLYSNPILEFRKREKTQTVKKVLFQPVVFIISNVGGEPLYCGRAVKNLSEAFSKFTSLHESDTLELFPFTREDAARQFYELICYHFNPKFNGDFRGLEITSIFIDEV